MTLAERNDRGYRKIRLVIVILVCLLALTQIICACTMKMYRAGGIGKGRIDGYSYQEMHANYDNVTEIDDYALQFLAVINWGLASQILFSLLTLISAIYCFCARRLQFFSIPLLQILPIMMIEEWRYPVFWSQACQVIFALSVISAVLFACYNFLLKFDARMRSHSQTGLFKEEIQEVELITERIGFDKDKKWDCYIPIFDLHFSANIEDEEFLKEVRNGNIRLTKDTLLTVSLKNRFFGTQKFGKLNRFTILKVNKISTSHCGERKAVEEQA